MALKPRKSKKSYVVVAGKQWLYGPYPLKKALAEAEHETNLAKPLDKVRVCELKPVYTFMRAKPLRTKHT